MKFQRIIEAVYFQPWMITPEAHASIRMVVQSRLMDLGEKQDVEWGKTDLAGDPLPSMNIEGSIATIPIKGMIMKGAGKMEKTCGAVSPDDISNNLKAALDHPKVRGIFLDINSPGGYTTGVHELAQEIAEARNKKPVIAYTDELIASAAYYMASSTSAIYASASSKIGSIGTYLYFLDWSEAYARSGVKPELFVSEGSIFKAMGASGVPLTNEQRGELQRTVNRTNEKFKNHVKGNRPQVQESAMHGQVLDGDEAKEFGLIDSISSYQTAYQDLVRMV